MEKVDMTRSVGFHSVGSRQSASPAKCKKMTIKRIKTLKQAFRSHNQLKTV